MFGGLQLKIIIALILISVISGGYFYIQALRGELAVAAEVQKKLEGVIEQQKLVMEKNAEDMRKMQEINQKVSEEFAKSQREVNALSKKFEKFANISKAKPTETEMRVNRGTRDALRCNELITGSPLTKEEKAGTIKNGICSEILDALIARENANAPQR